MSGFHELTLVTEESRTLIGRRCFRSSTPTGPQLLRTQLCRVEAMASADVPSTVLAQRLEDKQVGGCACSPVWQP